MSMLAYTVFVINIKLALNYSFRKIFLQVICFCLMRQFSFNLYLISAVSFAPFVSMINFITCLDRFVMITAVLILSCGFSSREGMLKLRDVYANNTALGDPSSLDKKVEENAQKIDTLRHELQKFEVMFIFYLCNGTCTYK